MTPTLRGPSLPSASAWPLPTSGVHEIKISHPPIEANPAFVGRIESRDLQAGVRHYNPSICRHKGRLLMAYRFESFTAVSRIGLAVLDEEFRVVRDSLLLLPEEPKDVHWEDARLCEAGGRLFIIAAFIRLVVPPICQQRLFEVDADASVAIREIPLGFGKIGGIEKNWSPFAMADGELAFVYQQKPRLVVEVYSRRGHESAGVPIAPRGASLSGRSPLARVGEHYLEFVGGWVREDIRGGRYWYGAQLVRGEAPFDVVKYLPEPLAWGSEASPTIHSPRPRGGHPVCLFPSGAVVEGGGDVLLSVGVNDSYCVLMRYNIADLIAAMVAA